MPVPKSPPPVLRTVFISATQNAALERLAFDQHSSVHAQIVKAAQAYKLPDAIPRTRRQKSDVLKTVLLPRFLDDRFLAVARQNKLPIDAILKSTIKAYLKNTNRRDMGR